LHCPIGTLQGEDFQQYVKGLGIGFPNASFEIDSVFSDGKMSALLWLLNKTQSGDFVGIPPSGKKTSVPGTSVMRFEGDRVAEAWSRWDRPPYSSSSAFRADPAAAGPAAFCGRAYE
jgi:predicted ester cyclase